MTRAQARSQLFATLQALDLRLRALHLDPPEPVGDAIDQQTANQLREEGLGEQARLIAHREQVIAALIRLEEGTWGQCITCNGPIAPDRLAAKPEAARCLGCETRYEAESREGQA